MHTEGGAFMAIIRPVRELRNNYNTLSVLAHETNQPIHISNNGHDDTVLMSEVAYEQLKRKAYIDYKLLEGELRGGKPVDARESLRKMREKVVAYIEETQD
jgi:PHD/YefM family antitoxin component YafN of YafNO toxin-antitoxin module